VARTEILDSLGGEDSICLCRLFPFGDEKPKSVIETLETDPCLCGLYNGRDSQKIRLYFVPGPSFKTLWSFDLHNMAKFS
jgi:hypothetical protein